jgi:hypothetical protein
MIPEIKNKKISDELVRRGRVFHLMTSIQRKFFEHVENSPNKTHALYSSRKIGKSYASLLYAFSVCIKYPNLVVRFVLSSFKQSKDVIFPIAQELQTIIPKDVYPKLRRSEATFVFNNGSVLICSGANPDAIEGNRGPKCDFLFMDEAPSWDTKNYDYLYRGVLVPQLSTSKYKKVIMCGTPSEDPLHPWFVQEYPKLKSRGELMEFTIWENPLLTDEDRTEILSHYNNDPNHPEFLREFCCKLITKQDLKVIPEFNKEIHTYSDDLAHHLCDCTGNQYRWQGIIAADLGVKDLTAIVGLIVNTFTQKVIVPFEIALKGNSLGEFAEAYTEMCNKMAPYCNDNIVSIVDCFEQSRITLLKDYNLSFQRPVKRSVEDNVATTRNYFARNAIEINSDCRYLLTQLEFGMFDSNRKVNAEFLRSTDQYLSHLDHLVSLCYGLRKVSFINPTKQIDLGLKQVKQKPTKTPTKYKDLE